MSDFTNNLGPLDWRIGIVDSQGRPTPEFQRRWAIQVDNNNLIGSIQTGTGAPTTIPTEGECYIDISTTPITFYAGHNSNWVKVGAYAFTDLTDAPHNYTGAAGELVRVNAGATGLEFDTLTATLDSLGNTQGNLLYRSSSGWTVLTPGVSGYILSTGGTGANPSWVASSSGGGGGLNPFVNTITHKPVATDFTVVSGGVTGTITNLASRGVSMAFPAPPAGLNGTYFQLTGYTPPSAGTDFSVTCFVSLQFDMSGNWVYGLTFRDTANKAIQYGFRNGGPVRFDYTTVTSLATPHSPYNAALSYMQGPIWLRLARVGSNFVFSISFDGETFYPIVTESTTAFLTATLQDVGFMWQGNGTPAVTVSLFDFYHTP